MEQLSRAECERLAEKVAAHLGRGWVPGALIPGWVESSAKLACERIAGHADSADPRWAYLSVDGADRKAVAKSLLVHCMKLVEWENSDFLRRTPPADIAAIRSEALRAPADEGATAVLRDLIEADRAEYEARSAQLAEHEAEWERERARQESERISYLRSLPHPPPEARPAGVSPSEAEQVVALWLRHHGASDAAVTRAVQSADGGVDVVSTEHRISGQVKHYTDRVVSVREVRELFGVAAARNTVPAFFTSSRYTPAAIDFAGTVNMPLFVYDVISGSIRGVNHIARTVLTDGVGSLHKN